MTQLHSHPAMRVDLGDRGYPIHIGSNLLSQLGILIEDYVPSKRIAIVTDENVYALYANHIETAFKDYQVTMIIRPAGEDQKSFTGLQKVLGALFEAGLDRSDLLVAFGGGVIGDLAGFAASIYKRGLPFVQVPTTLLAQVDSSVGGKTAINNEYGKNLVGAFYQPKAVIADTDVLSTLPTREIKAGYAEILKYGLLGDKDFFEWLDTEGGAKVLVLDKEALSKAITLSCQTKARIVAADEREAGQRALLNLGHSFAHALELDAGYGGDLLHGEAVSIGMDMAFSFCAKAGICSSEDANKVTAHLQKLSMPHMASQAARFTDPEKLTQYMGQDKKNEAGQITLILARAIGEAFVQKGVPRADVKNFLTSLSSFQNSQ